MHPCTAVGRAALTRQLLVGQDGPIVTAPSSSDCASQRQTACRILETAPLPETLQTARLKLSISNDHVSAIATTVAAAMRQTVERG